MAGGAALDAEPVKRFRGKRACASDLDGDVAVQSGITGAVPSPMPPCQILAPIS
jgi:hypothetical protein